MSWSAWLTSPDISWLESDLLIILYRNETSPNIMCKVHLEENKDLETTKKWKASCNPTPDMSLNNIDRLHLKEKLPNDAADCEIDIIRTIWINCEALSLPDSWNKLLLGLWHEAVDWTDTKTVKLSWKWFQLNYSFCEVYI